MKLNKTQLIHRIGSVIRGQVLPDVVNALIVNLAGIFESCGNTLLRISIAGTLTNLNTRMLNALTDKGEFALTDDLQATLTQIVDRGPIHVNDVVAENPAQTIEDMTKCGFIAQVSVQGDCNYVAATYLGTKLRNQFKKNEVQS